MRPAELRTALRLVVITDRRLAAPRRLVEVVGAALEGGARAVQLRNKGDAASELLTSGQYLRRLTDEHAALLFVNDRLDVALAIGADGVHLGPDDPPVDAIRAAAPEGFLIGYSADDPTVARAAAQAGANYIGCGTVYSTVTKPDAGDVIGLRGLTRVVEAVDVPVVAIGGITTRRAPEVAATGAAGVAVVREIMRAPDPAGATRSILAAFGAD